MSSIAELVLAAKCWPPSRAQEGLGPQGQGLSSEGLLEDAHPMVRGMLQASGFLKSSWASRCKWVETLLWFLLEDMGKGNEESEKKAETKTAEVPGYHGVCVWDWGR